MLNHDQVWQQLADYVADGEPENSEYVALRIHLHDCALCRAQLARLRDVESALRSYPLLRPSPELTRSILHAIRSEPRQEDWRLVPWSIWLPSLTLLLAFGFVAFVLPPHTQFALPMVSPEPLPATEAIQLREWLITSTQNDPFWPLWAGLLIVASGLGFALSLASWGSSTNRQFDRFESRLSSAAERLRQRQTLNRQ